MEEEIKKLADKYDSQIKKYATVLEIAHNDIVEGLKMGYEDALFDLKNILANNKPKNGKRKN